MKKYPAHFKLGTKVQDPLIRYSEYSTGPYKPCHKCSTLFTHLGLQHHIRRVHKGNPK